jgi:hypothetical protein
MINNFKKSQKLKTSELQNLPDGTIFSDAEGGLDDSPILYKKIETCIEYKGWPEGDVSVEPVCLAQFGEVPGERCRLGYTDKDDKEWLVWGREDIEKMVGWLMASTQYFED